MFTIEDGRYSNGFYKRQDQKTGAQINPLSGSPRTLETRQRYSRGKNSQAHFDSSYGESRLDYPDDPV